MVKKFLVSVLFLMFFLSSAACGAKQKLFEALNQKAALYAERAYELNEAVRRNYWIDGFQYAFHYSPNIPHIKNASYIPAYVWPYTEMVASSHRLLTLLTDAERSVDRGKSLLRYYSRTLDGYKYYLAKRDDYTCYTAARAVLPGGGRGDSYYDDNIWIAGELLDGYEILSDRKLLDRCMELSDYIWSGWAEDELGGIYWKEQDKATRNTCSNAPAIILFCRLYALTGEESCLSRAKKIYGFCIRNLRDSSDYVYFDKITNGGTVDRTKYTYNSGSMITAGVMLYEASKEEQYLIDASNTAKGSFSYFFRENSGMGFRQMMSDSPWFNVLLLNGYIELYRYDETTGSYIENYEKSINNAYDNYKNPQGFIPKNWASGFPKDAEGKPGYYGLDILDMAANAENYGLLAYFHQNVKK